jgi:hypothetical protein
MIGTARLYRCSVLLPRVPARHGDPAVATPNQYPEPCPG